MVYKKYANKRRVKRYHKRAYGAKRVAQIAKRAVRKTEEVKWIESTGFGTTSITTTWALGGMLSNIVQGTDLGKRVGNKIKLTGVFFRGLIRGGQAGTAADEAYNQVRIVMFLGDNGMTNANLTGVSMANIFNKESVLGFRRKLHDRIMTLVSPGVSGVGYQPAVREVRFFIRLNEAVTYKQSVAYADKDLYMGFLSDSAVVPNPIFMNSELRIYYTDA